MEYTICIAGLGYVGLPLATAFGKAGYKVIGFDVNEKKINELCNNVESMGEVDPEDLKKAKIQYTTNASNMSEADIIIITVPTPVSKDNAPDTSFVLKASEIVGKNMKKGAIVVYESTVYPGLTEEECVPILEEKSGMKYLSDFFVGYSPERINPGDKEHTIDKIVKIVSGCNEKTANILSKVYGDIIKAGIHIAPNIKTAESAKVIENIQRDLNIALMNELTTIFDRLGIDTKDVLKAAGTKWNFHKYSPGLVGGHCIGVDPYYLTYKAKKVGINPKIILAGRETNDRMYLEVVRKIREGLEQNGKKLPGSNILVMGLTFKKNITDTRNSKAKELIEELINNKCIVKTCDPMISKEQAMPFKGEFKNLKELISGSFDCIIILVAHQEFENLNTYGLLKLLKPNSVVFDLPRILDQNNITSAKHIYASL